MLSLRTKETRSLNCATPNLLPYENRVIYVTPPTNMNPNHLLLVQLTIALFTGALFLKSCFRTGSVLPHLHLVLAAVVGILTLPIILYLSEPEGGKTAVNWPSPLHWLVSINVFLSPAIFSRRWFGTSDEITEKNSSLAKPTAAPARDESSTLMLIFFLSCGNLLGMACMLAGLWLNLYAQSPSLVLWLLLTPPGAAFFLWWYEYKYRLGQVPPHIDR